MAVGSNIFKQAIGPGVLQTFSMHLCCKTITYPKTISTVKKGEAKKVQVTEQPKDVISLWGQEKKLHQQGCVYRTPAYI